MARDSISDFFKKPHPSWESKHEMTNRIAREIINSDEVAAGAKLERLKVARLAREAIGQKPAM